MNEDQDKTIAGLAALAICESLLIALTDLGIISVREERALLEDAAAAHRNDITSSSPEAAKLHLAVATEIQRIIDGRRSAWATRTSGLSPGDANG